MSFFEELKRRNVIRVAIAYALIAWVLLQAADFALDLIGAPDWVLQALAVLAVIGLPAVLVFSWIFEMTPEGIRREKHVARDRSITTQTGRKLDKAIIGALVLAVAYLLVDKLWLQDRPNTGSGSISAASGLGAGLNDSEIEPDPKSETPAVKAASVAVLPFVNMSDDPQNEYFSDGLTETLLHMLAQIPDLQVAARTSSFAFKGQNKGVSEIAAELGVANILEGSVQKSGDRVRVTAQLVRASDGFHVWSQNYTRPLEDIFAIQDEIAEDVASALGASLLGEGANEVTSLATHDLTAFDEYLKGLEEQALFSYASLPKAENHFKAALVQDPGFTDARLALVRNFLLSANTGLIDDEQMQRAVTPLLETVRASDPDNPLARAFELNMGMQFDVSLSLEERKAKADELRSLLAVIPTESFVRQRLAGLLYGFFRDTETAIALLQAGLLIDPMSADLHGQLGDIYREEGELDLALASQERAVELAPGNPNHYSDLADLELERNNLAAAMEWMRRSTEVDPRDHELAAAIATMLYALGQVEEGDRWLTRVQALAPGSAVARRVALQRADARGEAERVIELAAAMIRDQVEDRQGAFFTAVFRYVDTAMTTGRSAEAFEFLASVRPEILQFDANPGDFRGLGMQFGAALLMGEVRSVEEQREAWTRMTQVWDAMGFPWRDPRDMNLTWHHLILGDVAAATNSYLQGPMSRPLATRLNRVQRDFPDLLGPVYADPRVQARLAELDAQYAVFQADVEAMLERPEWQ